jgi:hypothetical protein
MSTNPNLITHFEEICSNFFKKVIKNIVKPKPKIKSDNNQSTSNSN